MTNTENATTTSGAVLLVLGVFLACACAVYVVCSSLPLILTAVALIQGIKWHWAWIGRAWALSAATVFGMLLFVSRRGGNFTEE